MRVSDFLGRKAISAIKQAPRTAEAIGRPLNLFVTINVYHTACSVEDISKKFQVLRSRRFARWASYKPSGAQFPRNGSPTDAWVLEAPNSHHNIHWLLYVRPERQREFIERLEIWVSEVFGEIGTGERVVHVQHADRPAGAAKYMAKGADPKYVSFYWLDDVAKPQGMIYGKRGGVSQNLATAAREKLKRSGKIPRRVSQQIYPNHAA